MKHGFWLTNPTFLEHVVLGLQGAAAAVDYKTLMPKVDTGDAGGDGEAVSISLATDPPA